jgi:hypothetical protein
VSHRLDGSVGNGNDMHISRGTRRTLAEHIEWLQTLLNKYGLEQHDNADHGEV